MSSSTFIHRYQVQLSSLLLSSSSLTPMGKFLAFSLPITSYHILTKSENHSPATALFPSSYVFPLPITHNPAHRPAIRAHLQKKTFLKSRAHGSTLSPAQVHHIFIPCSLLAPSSRNSSSSRRTSRSLKSRFTHWHRPEHWRPRQARKV